MKTQKTHNYWNDNGAYQSLYDAYYERLVPSSGNAGTVLGEMLRATSRIYYDYYNNGMCNNTSGAVNFLYDCFNNISNSGNFPELLIALNHVYNECNTGSYTSVDLKAELETIVNFVVVFTHNHLDDKVYNEPSDVNMFDFQDDDYDDDDYFSDED